MHVCILEKKVLAFKTPGFPTVLRPRTYTNIIGYQILSVTVTTVTTATTVTTVTKKGHEPKATNQRPRIKATAQGQEKRHVYSGMYALICLYYVSK